MTPVRDLVVLIDVESGQLRRVAHVLGSVEINIEGLSVLTGQRRSVIHLLVADYERALLAVAGAEKIEARAVHDALVLNLAGRPDELADCLRPFEQAGINIGLAYLAVGSRSQTRLVVVPDDPERAHVILAECDGKEKWAFHGGPSWRN